MDAKGPHVESLSDPFLRTSLHQHCEQSTPVIHMHTREHEHMHTLSDTNTDNRC